MSSFFAALGIVFLAELGDKTQLVALGFGARYRLTTVLAGVAGGYMASMLLSVVIGGSARGRVADERHLDRWRAALRRVRHRLAAIRRVMPPAMTTTICWPTSVSTNALGDGALAGESGSSTFDTRVVASIAAAMFVAELGDKTMLATATLAAKGNPVLVWFGATIGIMLAGTVGVVIGRWLGDRLPERVILIGSSVLFLVFGIVLIATGILGAT